MPTPAEIAEYEAAAGPKPINPLVDFSAEDIAKLAVEDKDNFSIPEAFAQAKDLHGDPAFVQKVADANNIVNRRGFSTKDLPSVKQAAGAVGTTIKGLAGQIWNYASAAGNAVAGAASELVGAEGMASAYSEDINKRLAENIAGTEEAMTGLSQLATKGVRKAGQATGLATSFEEMTPAQRVTELFNKAAESEVRGERLSGKGEFSKAITGGETELNPEKVGELAAGDPFAFFAFGSGAGALGKAVKAVTPAAVGAVASKVGQAAANVVPKIGGGLVQAAGKTAEGALATAGGVGKAAQVLGPIAGAASALAGADITGAGIGGLAAGATGRAVARGAQLAKPAARAITDLGKQIAGSAPIKSAYAQAGRDVLQALPGAAYEVGKGTALDIGLAAATAEVPQDTQGAVGFGAALGALAGARRVGNHVLSGQLVAPRSYGIDTPQRSSGQFSTLDAMHNTAMQTATPGVKARVNALRQFAEGVAPGTDVFVGADSAAVKQALIDSGVSPATAESFSQASGFFTADLPGKDGKPRRVIIASDVDSVPHEAQHAIQDVLGEEANQKVDAIVREAYADTWEKEGQSYADRITGKGDPRTWQEVILDETGKGLAEAKEKIYRDIYNRVEAETGAAPSPAMIAEMAKTELGQRMDAAVEANPQLDPNEVGRKVWRDVFADAPEQVQGMADQYMARELAAENFDAVFKSQGPRLQEGKQLPQRLARIVGSVISAFGGDPLTGRASEVGATPLRTPVVEAVRGAAAERLGAVEPKAAAPAAVRDSSPIAAAEEARTLAAEAPEVPIAGGTRSPRELLGQIAESIATGEGVRINYLSAPGEPAAATTSNRTQRRAIIEAFRIMPPEARALWEKTFFPEKVTRTKNGQYQVQGWAPEVFASNAHKLAEFIADNPNVQSLSPYAVDANTRSFTPEAWQELYADTQRFVQNQARGATGSGEPLVVPRSVTDAGGYAPPVRAGAEALPQGKADFINMLFNFKLPETPRIQAGRRPLNVIGQEVSAATLPGELRFLSDLEANFLGRRQSAKESKACQLRR